MFAVVDKVASHSGWHWSNETGASIGQEEKATWDAFVEVCGSLVLALMALLI